MEDRMLFTPRGKSLLEEQLKENNQTLEEAMSQIAYIAESGGDQWHDNGSYDAQTAEIRRLDRWHLQLVEQDESADLLERPQKFNVVCVGTEVTCVVDGKKEVWKVGGYGESDFEGGIVAYNTPFAKALINKKVGDQFCAVIGKSEKRFEILNIVDATDFFW